MLLTRDWHLKQAEAAVDVRSISIEQINIGERQRQDVGDINDLAANIRHHGLLHPIVITRDSAILMAGYRRLQACRMLGWTQIPAHFFEELPRRQQHAIEYVENNKRQNLTWEENAKAVYNHHMMCVTEEGPSWTTEKTGDELNLAQNSVSRYIVVYKEMNNNPSVREALRDAKSIGTAANTVSRLKERREADAVYTSSTVDRVYTGPIHNADFNEWAPTYDGPKFNLIHCDFPYGINAHKYEGQSQALDVEYNDNPETFWQLFDTLRHNLDNFCADSAHIIFWFSPTLYCDLRKSLVFLDGFKFDDRPLIWMRGENEGIAPDPQRRPRWCYEMAWFGWRNNRPIIKVKPNIVQASAVRKDHPHEKSEAALTHFFEMVVDQNTRLLDPTCGSGSALRAAKALGAKDENLLGLEASEEYATLAQRAFNKEI